MKKLFIISLLVFVMVASLALAPGEPTATNAPVDDPVACCMAMTAQCLACAEGISVEEYCAANTDAIGCDDANQAKTILTIANQGEAQELKEQLIAQYGNDAEALREAYKEQARNMLQEYKGDMEQLAKEYRAQSAEELKGYAEAQKEMYANELDAKREEVKAKVQERMQEENEVRLAVHTMLAMENMAGGIGRNISVIAQQMNNRVETVTELKEKAAKTKGLGSFFAGGDEETATQLHEEAKMYQEKVRELKQLRTQANLDEETATLFDEQIQTMEQEQLRLQKLADKEDNRGLLGWIWKNKVQAEDTTVAIE